MNNNAFTCSPSPPQRLLSEAAVILLRHQYQDGCGLLVCSGCSGIACPLRLGQRQRRRRNRFHLKSSDLDLANIADLWMHGSVVRSWLLELGASALKDDPKLESLKGYVQDSGEGRWMLMDALDKDVPVPTLATALFTRFRSRQEESFSEKMLAALRNAFGGHSVKR